MVFPQEQSANQLMYVKNRLHALLFWGFDASKVTNVACVINDTEVFNGPLDVLEYHKQSLGYGEMSAALILMSPSIYKTTNAAVAVGNEPIWLRISTTEAFYELHVQAIHTVYVTHRKRIFIPHELTI
jgi:hypothetical protein